MGDKWQDQLSDDLKTSEQLAKFDSIEGLAKSYTELERRQGRSVVIPGEDAGDEARAKFIEKLQQAAPELMLRPDTDDEEGFRKLLGVPDDPKGYSHEFEELHVADDVVSDLQAMAKEAGLTPTQYRKMLAQIDSKYATNAEAAQAAQDADRQALKAVWGENTDHNKRQVHALLERFQNPEMPLEGELNAAGYQALYNMAQAFRQDPQGHSQALSESAPGLTPGEAKEKATELMERLRTDTKMPPEERRRLLRKLNKLNEAQRVA